MVDLDDLSIICYPDPRLRRRSRPVETIDDQVIALAERMKELTLEANGLGLAAPQTGRNLRMFIGREGEEGREFEVYINPVLHEGEGQSTREEGCLSLPDIRGDVFRPQTITIEYTNLQGQRRTRTDNDMQARMWQHENDHLNGVLIIDRFGPLDKLRFRRALKALEKEFAAFSKIPVLR